jgi:probable HAF family extracellular repeat protein
MTDLGPLGGITSEARAINNRGQFVGTSGTANGTVRAVLWEDSSGAWLARRRQRKEGVTSP